MLAPAVAGQPGALRMQWHREASLPFKGREVFVNPEARLEGGQLGSFCCCVPIIR